MRRRWNKLLTASMAVALAAATTACNAGGSTGGSKDGGAATPPEPSKAPAAAEKKHPDKNANGFPWIEGTNGLQLPVSDKQLELKIMIPEHPSFPVRAFDQSPWQQEVTKKTNVKMNLQAVPASNYAEKLNIVLNTRDFPDVIWKTQDDAQINKIGNKAFLAVDDYLKHMPNVSKLLKDNPDIRNMLKADDGKLYILPYIASEQNNMTVLLMVREDLMQKHNLKEPKTYDELYTFLKTLKEKEPNMIGWTGRNYGTATANAHIAIRLAHSWGTGYGPDENAAGFYFDESKGKYAFGPTEDNFRKMLEWLKKLNDEKLLDPENPVQQSKQWEEKMSNSRALMTMEWNSRVKWANDLLNKANKTDRWVGITPPKGPTGKQGFVYRSSVIPGEGLVVNKDVKDPVAVMKFIDFMYSDEGRILYGFGIEGETFKRNGNGTFSWTDNMKEHTTPTGKEGKDLRLDYGWVNNWGKYEINNIEFDAEKKGVTSYVVKKVTPNENNYSDRQSFSRSLQLFVKPYPVLNFSDAQQTTRKSKETQIRDHVLQNVDKFILGARPFSEWDKFKDEIEKLGVQDVLKVYNEAYEVFKKN